MIDFVDNTIDKLESFFLKIFKCKWLYYILLILIIYFVYLSVFEIDLKQLELSNKYLTTYYMGSMIVSLITIILLILNNKVKLSIEGKFLFISLILGFTYTFASPVFTQSDESYHFIRAYQVAKGDLISPTDSFGNAFDNMPKSIYKVLWDDDDIYPEYKNYEDIKRLTKVPLNKNDVSYEGIRASIYIFLNYIPHAIGIKVGMIFNLPPYFVGLLGRLTNMLICTLLLYVGLKILPIAKKTMALLLLSPTVIAYNASMSADGVVTVASFLLTALVLKCVYEKPKLNYKWYTLFMIIVLFVSTCKTAYLPLIGILIFLPYDCFKDKKNKWIYSISLILFGIFTSMLWMKVGHVIIGEYISEGGMAKYIHFVKVYFLTMMKDTVSYVQNVFAGNYLYQAQVNPYSIISIIYLMLFVLSFISEKDKNKMRSIEKMVVAFIMVVIITLVAYAMYANNTKIESDYIIGIQGRYYIPMLLLLPFFSNNKSKLNLDDNIIFDISLILNLCVLLTMISIFTI